MKYFITINQNNRVNGVYTEEYMPEDLTFIEVSEEVAKLPSTTTYLEDWLFYNNQLQRDPITILEFSALFIQSRRDNGN